MINLNWPIILPSCFASVLLRHGRCHVIFFAELLAVLAHFVAQEQVSDVYTISVMWSCILGVSSSYFLSYWIFFSRIIITGREGVWVPLARIIYVVVYMLLCIYFFFLSAYAFLVRGMEFFILNPRIPEIYQLEKIGSVISS